MNPLIMVHAIFLASFCVAVIPAFGQQIDLFIVAGQSHMQGWQGDAQFYPVDLEGLDSKIKFYWLTPDFGSSGGKWLKMESQGGRFLSGHFGPEVIFARELQKNGYNTAIFKFSRGGTSLADDWRSPGEGGLYDQMVDECRKAISLLEAEDGKVAIRAFVWLQGGSDSFKAFAPYYLERLKRLIDNIRKEVTNNVSLPVILGLDEQHPSVKKNQLVVLAQKQLAATDDNIVFISMKGLEKFDSTHLTPKAIQNHGKRLFVGFQSIINQIGLN